jgi:acetyl-CoA carboxylase carboxyltransferase component
MIAVMGPEAAVNAVYANKIAALPEDERPEFVARMRAEFAADVDIIKLASELIIDGIVPGDELRAELVKRFAYYREGYELPGGRKHGVTPV